MNLAEELFLRPPQNRLRGTIVRGPCYLGDDGKPPGRPKGSSRHDAVLASLSDGPATRSEISALTAIKVDAVKKILYKLRDAGHVKCLPAVMQGSRHGGMIEYQWRRV